VGRLDVSENAYFPRLFSPLRVGQRTLRNRIGLPATTTNYGARLPQQASEKRGASGSD
jgi:2,4-dienoyl-CoA reductase-like NADH-dependent reductase (Old Yellow Enzyme family)